jgi:hypothetical protein
MKTKYRNMNVYVGHDKTQCLLDVAVDKNVLITTEMEKEWDSPIFLQGPTKVLHNGVGKDIGIETLYNEVKDENYFVILTEDWSNE